MHQSIVLLCVALVCTAQIVAVRADLVYATVLHRHGDRAPYMNLPKYNVEVNFPEGLGQLTTKGLQDGYRLGQLLRARFVGDGKLLSPNWNYNRDQLFVRSTDVDRTLMTTSALLSALLPPAPDQQVDPSVPWRPIPVHTVPFEQEQLLRPFDETCPRFQQLLADTSNSPHLQQLLDANADFLAKMKDATGITQISLLTIDGMWDIVNVENIHNKTHLPFFNDPNNFKIIKDLAFAYYDHLYDTFEKKRLTGGNLLKDILYEVDTKIKAQPNTVDARKKMKIYSAHDTTVSALLGALNYTFDGPPPYAAYVITELHFVNNSYFLKMDYLDNPVVLEGCQYWCPLDKFKAITKDTILDNWFQECVVAADNNSTSGDNTFVYILVAVTVALFIIICVMARKKTSDQNPAIDLEQHLTA